MLDYAGIAIFAAGLASTFPALPTHTATCFSAAAAKGGQALLAVTLLLAMSRLSFAVEAVADHQKFTFKNDEAHKGAFITSGLWAWSRHPNYFGAPSSLLPSTISPKSSFLADFALVRFRTFGLRAGEMLVWWGIFGASVSLLSTGWGGWMVALAIVSPVFLTALLLFAR